MKIIKIAIGGGTSSGKSSLWNGFKVAYQGTSPSHSCTPWGEEEFVFKLGSERGFNEVIQISALDLPAAERFDTNRASHNEKIYRGSNVAVIAVDLATDERLIEMEIERQMRHVTSRSAMRNKIVVFVGTKPDVARILDNGQDPSEKLEHVLKKMKLDEHMHFVVDARDTARVGQVFRQVVRARVKQDLQVESTQANSSASSSSAAPKLTIAATKEHLRTQQHQSDLEHKSEISLFKQSESVKLARDLGRVIN